MKNKTIFSINNKSQSNYRNYVLIKSSNLLTQHSMENTIDKQSFVYTASRKLMNILKPHTILYCLTLKYVTFRGEMNNAGI